MRELVEHIQRRVEVNEGWRQNVAAGSLALGLLTGAGNAQASGHLQKHHHHQHTYSQKNYSQNDIINAIAGEAGGSGYEGMLAIASAIRNRMHGGEYKHNILKGVAGLHAKHLKTDQKSEFMLARKAWDESARNNIVPGCTLWGNKDDVENKWTNGSMDMSKIEFVKEVGGNYFYRYK